MSDGHIKERERLEGPPQNGGYLVCALDKMSQGSSGWFCWWVRIDLLILLYLRPLYQEPHLSWRNDLWELGMLLLQRASTWFSTQGFLCISPCNDCSDRWETTSHPSISYTTHCWIHSATFLAHARVNQKMFLSDFPPRLRTFNMENSQEKYVFW